MGKIDPAKERARLAALYSEMNDLELQKVGANPEALTEWARAALLEEMRKRGLAWKREPQAKPISDEEILMRLREYPERNSAGVDHDFLGRVGIKAFLFEDVSADRAGQRVDSNGTHLLVRARDLAAARQQLTDKDEMEAAIAQETQEPAPPSKPVVLRQYRDITEAMVDKTALESAGIACFLYDDNLVRLDWFISNAIGGVKLVVAQNTAEEADRILSAAAEGIGGDSAQG